MDRSKYLPFVFGVLLILAGIFALQSSPLRTLLNAAATIIKNGVLGPHFFSQLEVLAQEAIFRGLLFIALWLFILANRQFAGFIQNRNRVLWIAALLLIAIYLPIIVFGHSAVIDGERIWWLADDPMISMRYAHNLAQGHGLVWNPGERVEGYTTFLWTLFMAIPHLLPIPLVKTSLFILLANILIALAALYVLARLMEALCLQASTFIAVLMAFVWSKNILAWAVSGFETLLLLLLTIFIVYLLVVDAQRQKIRFFSIFLIGIIPLVRSDGWILAGLLYLLAIVLLEDKQKVFWYTVTSLVLPISHLLFRLVYYGSWLPNTAYLKMFGWPGRYGAGIGYTLGFLWHYFFLFVFAVGGVIRSRERLLRLLLLGCGLYALYVAYTGGDAFGNYRFFVPILPLLFLLGFYGIECLSRSLLKRWLLLIFCFTTLPLSPMSYLTILRPYPFDVQNIKLGLLIKKNTPAECKVADCWGGSVFYFSERYGVDLLGKMDPTIARRPAFAGANMAGHNKFDYSYSLSTYRPDIVIANFKVPTTDEQMFRQASGDWAFVGQLYFNPIFQQLYLPYPVEMATSRTIFVRGDSPLMARREKWLTLRE